MTNFNCRLVANAADTGDVSKSFGRIANFLRSSVSGGAISTRSAALILAAAVPLTLSSTSAYAVCAETAPGSGIFACSGVDVVTLTPASAPGGDLVVTTTAPFSVIAPGDGILLTNAGADVGISFIDNNASTIITGSSDGLDINNNGTGALTIVTSGRVTGNSDVGIEATNAASATNLSITVNAGSVITADEEGINADNNGSGTSMIIINGTINAEDEEGIDFDDSATSGAVTIIVGATGVITSGDDDAINADSDGVGDLTVIINGRLDGDSDGIDIDKSGTGNIIVMAGVDSNIKARFEGIETDLSSPGGTTTIVANGKIIANDFGIEADNTPGSGFISITTGASSSIIAEEDGINADQDGNGPLTINAGGTITSMEDGIEARSTPTSPIVINVSGVTTGGVAGFFGIKTITGATGMTTLTLNSGAVVSATSGDAISNDAGDSTTTVNTGASVLGTINLGDGSDNLIFAGGDFSGVTLFDGGDDMSPADTFIDTLTFAGSSGAVTGANVMNFEKVVIGAGSTISFSDNMVTTGELMTSAGGTLSATGGTLMITANVINNGTISARNGVANDRVEVSGNYSGTGTLAVDVNLATNKSDVLAVAGNATGGATTITANYLSPTSANGANILVVDVTGTSSAGGFALGNPVSGAFAYDLSQIGADWFLRQTGFNPATPTYEAYPQVLSNLNQLSSLQQRTANRKSVGSGSSTSAALGYAPATKKRKEFAQFDNDTSATEKPFIWGRIEGSKSTVASSVSRTGSSFDTNRWALHVGIDSQLPINSAGQLFLGINTSLGGANTDVTSATGNGSINTESYGFGFSATWFANSGFYVDGQAQATWFTSDLNNVANGALINNNSGRGVAFSIEVGKGFEVGNGWILTPQAQLMTSSINFDNFTGPNGELISLGDESSFTGRLGARIEHKGAWGSSGGSQSTIYALANVYSKFSGESRVTVTGVNFNSRPDEWTGEIGVGGSVDVGSFANGGHVSLYGQGTVGTSLTNFGDSNQYGALAGVKLRF